jgi:hypothetical protein
MRSPTGNASVPDDSVISTGSTSRALQDATISACGAVAFIIVFNHDS